MEELVKALIKELKMDDNIFNYQAVAEEIERIDKKDYLDFYKEVLKREHFGNKFKIICDVAKEFKVPTKKDTLLINSRDEAKSIYNKFYCESCAMLDFTQKNRNKYPSDFDFFMSVDYSTLKRKDGSKTYNKKELYVLNELGGGKWLLNIKMLENSSVAISKIENIIKKGIETKYANNGIIDKKVLRCIS